ncbi:hypothetical protein DCO17_10290 [Polynucleobacter tropicus]|uniref:Uncharacterized protein n=1 Tax=Polynucleobacter tropicus TaxID=1743174 RepID=A0A6M9PZC7_9BURK|nr:hypothetical protein [Polynucleobacter tropicus]QKM65591.1 hypothetical protein DCO17_10290 [Polynucleobacter tropicus]
MDSKQHKQISLDFANEVVDSLNQNKQQSVPKDILAEIFEKSDEEFLLSCYAVHREFETKAGRQPQTLEEYTKEFYREKTEEEIKQAEQFQDEIDTYLRHNGPIGSRARAQPKLTFLGRLQKWIHNTFK